MQDPYIITDFHELFIELANVMLIIVELISLN